MMRIFAASAIAASLLSAASISVAAPTPAAGPPYRITPAALENKIRGGWAGQMIGVAYGAPTEFKSNGAIIETNIGNYQDWKPERIAGSINQDDLYVEMTFAEVMDKVGLNATTKQYGEMFKNTEYPLWHANAAARRLLNQGLSAPSTGHPKYNAHANDIDFQIEADFIGLMAPGLPKEANKYADRVGRVMNWGDGLYGGMSVSGMYAAAYFEDDPRRVVEKGLLSIPANSSYARLIRDVLQWSAKHPDDWKAVWQLIQDKWDKDDPCPDGADRPFNIDARLNGAYIVLGLLYGQRDFAKTLDIATRAGQDSDCNPSSAAGILGVMLGYDAIPDQWKSGIPAIASTRFAFTRYSFNEIVASTMARARKVVRSAGGQVSPTVIVIPRQQPLAPKLEQWDMGSVKSVVEYDSPEWRYSGNFADGARRVEPYGQIAFKEATGEGASATLTFEGRGITLVGLYSGKGGRADVFLDGRPVGLIDAWIPDNTEDSDYWHVSGLRPGKHVVTIVTRSDAHRQSTGKRIEFQKAVVYQ